MDLGIEREYGSAPTLDTERKWPYRLPRWDPQSISIFNHLLKIDIPTGNLFIDTDDISYPYQGRSLSIRRHYDAQEQYMQLAYLQHYPNVDPKPHFFGNWSFGFEADIEDIWHTTTFEIQLNAGEGVGGLFASDGTTFRRNIAQSSVIESALRTYGVPGRLLADLQWNFQPDDLVLRTLMGPFQLAAGRFNPQTPVDDASASIWVFKPSRGVGSYLGSDYFYDLPGPIRDVGFPILLTKVVDALGHSLTLSPTSNTPPYSAFSLTDGAARSLLLQLGQSLLYPDGLNPGGQVRRLFVSQVVDETKTAYNTYSYTYSEDSLLDTVTFPSSIGASQVSYGYDDPDHPGILTSITDSFGHTISFEYEEDSLDNDDRLNPRLKISRIIDPEGINFAYQYDPIQMVVTVTISKGNQVDRVVTYSYIRDDANTKKRFIVQTGTDVTRGYLVNSNGAVAPIPAGTPQAILDVNVYSTDGRFNLLAAIDPIGRRRSYLYNDFNQVVESTDFDGHKTTFTFDIPTSPSPSNPVNYDMLSTSKENILRKVSSRRPLTFSDVAANPTKTFTYAKYDATNSSDPSDAAIFSTHRKVSGTDELGSTWTYSYDDLNNFNSLDATSVTTPLGSVAKSVYDSTGNVISLTDAQGNTASLLYNAQGKLIKYTDPNWQSTLFEYYPCGGWLHVLTDQLAQVTTFTRDVSGRITNLQDPVNDSMDYSYYSNGRVQSIQRHRPSFNPAPALSTTFSISSYPNVTCSITYTPFGRVSTFTNPGGLTTIFEYDEAGRLFRWRQGPRNPFYTAYVYDAASQLQSFVDCLHRVTTYSYHNSGFLRSVVYPGWQLGAARQAGKTVTYDEYDYLGRLLSSRDSELPHTLYCVYDLAGNLALRSDYDGFLVTMIYDKESRLVDAEDSTRNFKFVVQLDSLSRPSSMTDSAVLDGPVTWHYTYVSTIGGSHQVLQLFERSIPTLGLATNFTYNPRNQLGSIETLSNSNALYSASYIYGADSLLSQITSGSPDSFVHDGLKQIVFEGGPALVSDYDLSGNRMFRASPAATLPARNRYNALNQLLNERSTGGAFSYDSDGNTATATNPIASKFSYDGAGRLRAVSSNRFDVRYLYDAVGNLVERTRTVSGGRPVVTRFHYFLGRPVVIEESGRTSQILTWDHYGTLLRARTPSVVAHRPSLRNSAFTIVDGFGSIVGLVDSSGNTLGQTSYDVWGNATVSKPAPLPMYIGWRCLFSDPETGLVKAGVRWYRPSSGRWISQDPIPSTGADPVRLLPDFSNLYAFVANNPADKSDFSGLDEEQEFWLSLGDQPNYGVLPKDKRTPMASQIGDQQADEILWTVQAFLTRADMIDSFLHEHFGADKDFEVTSVVKPGEHTAYRKIDVAPRGTTSWDELAAAAAHAGFWVHAEGVTLGGQAWPLSPNATGPHLDLYLIQRQMGDFPQPDSPPVS